MDEQRVHALQQSRYRLWEDIYSARWNSSTSKEETRIRVHELLEKLSKVESDLRVSLDAANEDCVRSLKLSEISGDNDESYVKMMERIRHAKEAASREGRPQKTSDSAPVAKRRYCCRKMEEIVRRI